MAEDLINNALSTNISVRVSHKVDKKVIINNNDGFDLTPSVWGQTETVDAKDMAFKGVNKKSELEFNFGDADNFSSTILSKWGTVRNIEVSSSEAGSVALAQYVHADVTLGGDAGEKTDITLTGIKRGNIDTADADDTVTIDAYTNGGSSDNLFTINTGLGDDVVEATGSKGRTRFDIDTGEGEDSITLDGGFSLADLSLGDGNDDLSIKQDGGRSTTLKVDAGEGNDELNIDGAFRNANLNLGEGDDELNLTAEGRAVPVTINAGEGNDKLTLDGSFRKSLIQLGEGDDELALTNQGSRPQITVEAGDGNDKLAIQGSMNKALFDLGEGDDELTINVAGNRGNITVNAGEGADKVTLQGSYKLAKVSLGGGDDSFTGSAGRDRIFGQEGDDVLRGGLGRDSFYGGEGVDTFIIDVDAGSREVIYDFTLDEVIDLSAFEGLRLEDIASQHGRNVRLELGEKQTLTIKGTKLTELTDANFTFGGDVVEEPPVEEPEEPIDPGMGTEGDDHLTGTVDADTLNGLTGSDTLNGAQGDDTLTGGEGADIFVIDQVTGNKVITDFTPAEGDLIDLRDFNETLYFEDLNIYADGDDTVLDLGNGITITLQGVATNQLAVEQFMGVTPGSDPAVEGMRIEGTVQPFAVEERVSFQDMGEITFADFNGDGTTDIISQNGAYGQGIVWMDGNDMTVNRALFLDPGDHRLVDFNGDGTLDIISDTFGGLGWFDGSDTTQFNRITSNNVGDYRVVDIDGNGSLDIVSNMGSYSSGVAINGAVWYNASGAMNRVTYHDMGEGYKVVDIDQDGALEIVSNDGTYASGAALEGLVYHELDGTIVRHTFASDSKFMVGNFDGDSGLEILTNDAVYTSGVQANGAIVFQGGNVGTRFTYNNLGDFVIADIDGDGKEEIISNKGSYQDGTLIDGIMRYNFDGTSERVGYQDVEKLHVGDWDGDGVDDILATGGIAGTGIIKLNIGSGNNDVLDGGENNDTLNGGGGDDTMTGGGADDIFEFGNGFGDDTITDFSDGTNQLLFTAESGVENVAEVLNSAEVVGSNTVITLNEGSITLTGFTGLEASHVTVL